MNEPRDYPPEQASVLWMVGWDENVFTLLDSGKRSYLFGPHAIRSAFGTEGMSGVKLHIRQGEAVASFPSDQQSRFKQSLIEHLGPAHETLYALRVTRRSAALAILAYRRDRESRYAKWNTEDNQCQK